MDIRYFKEHVAPELDGYELIYNSYPEGDFGLLERVIIEGRGKIAGVDIWSKGWLDIDIYNVILDEQMMNVLLEPTEIKEQEDAIIQLLWILKNE